MFKRILISMHDKSIAKDLAECCRENNIAIVASDGTASFLEKEGFSCQRVEDITHFPELLGGRVKTLHPLLHAGILADKERSSHREDLAHHNITTIDVVAVSLYPLEQTIAQGAAHDAIIESIDIGGVTLLRGAAKNYRHVLPLHNRETCDTFITMIKSKKPLTPEMRCCFAAKTLAYIAHYDAVAAQWFDALQKTLNHQEEQQAPPVHTITGTEGKILRYGENPQQSCVLYTMDGEHGVPQSVLLQGSSMSYNNVLDANAAIDLVGDLSLIDDGDAACVIKHGTPCGAALGKTLQNALSDALATDKESAFGGIIALNGRVDVVIAQMLSRLFLEVILAPSFSDEALVILKKRPRMRVMRLLCLEKRRARDERRKMQTFRSIRGGFLLQTPDTDLAGEDWQTRAQRSVRTKKQPTKEEYKALECVSKVCQHSRSNAIVLGLGTRITAIGSGQTSRVEAARCAIARHASFMSAYGREVAGETLVAASDGFFPFPDALDMLIKHGVKIVIQPGGSKNDAKVLEVAQREGIVMIMDGMRHFSH